MTRKIEEDNKRMGQTSGSWVGKGKCVVVKGKK